MKKILLSAVFAVLPMLIFAQTTLLSENFQTGSLPASWTVTQSNPNETWHVEDPLSGTDYRATVNYDETAAAQNEWLITPSLDLSSYSYVTLNAKIGLSYYWSVSPNNNYDAFIKVSTDGGTNWTQVWSETNLGTFTNWTMNPVTVNLAAYAGNPNVKIAFQYVGADGAALYVDDVSVVASSSPMHCGPLTFGFVEPITNVTFAGINNTTSAATTSSPHEFFLDKIADVKPGETHTISLQGYTGGNYTNRFYIFIDWNEDGDWDDANEKYIPTASLLNSTGVDGKTVTMDILVPADATPGSKRMRIKKTYSTTTYDNPCTNGSSFGQAEDYTVRIKAPLVYCGPLNFTSVEPITNVTFAGINNTTSASTSGQPAHEFFLDQIGTVEQLQTYTISLQGNTDGNFSTRFYIFFDWNQDGDFDDAGEFYGPSPILLNSTGTDGKTVTMDILIPAGATLGETRMRVKKTFGSAGTHTDPCVPGTTYGQAEDYTIKVNPGTPCTGAPSTVTATSSTPSACPGVSFTLSSDVAATVGYSYQWQSSTDSGTTWNNLGAAQTLSSSYTVDAQTVTTQYRLVVTCTSTNQSTNSNVLTISQNTADQCYCKPLTDCTDGDSISNVTFAGISNPSACSANGYSDYTASVAPAQVVTGQSYPISVTTGAGWTYETTVVWIDYNKDGVFDTSEHTVVGSTPGTQNGTIAIQAGLAEGDYRMRVRTMAVNPTHPDTGDLGTYACNEEVVYAETEDYLVHISTLGVADISRQNIKAYPNPVKDIFTIEAQGKIKTVKVFDASGKQLLTKEQKDVKTQIDFSRFAAGVYVVTTVFEDGSSTTTKVIKK